MYPPKRASPTKVEAWSIAPCILIEDDKPVAFIYSTLVSDYSSRLARRAICWAFDVKELKA